MTVWQPAALVSTTGCSSAGAPPATCPSRTVRHRVPLFLWLLHAPGKQQITTPGTSSGMQAGPAHGACCVLAGLGHLMEVLPGR